MLKRLSQRAQTETPAKTVIQKRDIQRLFITDLTKYTEKLPFSPLKKFLALQTKT